MNFDMANVHDLAQRQNNWETGVLKSETSHKLTTCEQETVLRVFPN